MTLLDTLIPALIGLALAAVTLIYFLA